MTRPTQRRINADAIVETLLGLGAAANDQTLMSLVRSYADAAEPLLSKSELLASLDANAEFDRSIDESVRSHVRSLLTKKPIRSLSGIASITVLTKPYPCPGKCVFCPVDVRMPKSYVATEPGAQRAAMHGFDPFAQTQARLRAYREMGHPTGKIELIILGGTWSSYPHAYQRWFIKRLFDALNHPDTPNEASSRYEVDENATLPPDTTYDEHINKSHFVHTNNEESATWDELAEAHRLNEHAPCRCVGLSLETRPDAVNDDECIRMRRLGATKVQIGIQSLNDDVLKANKRGHRVADTHRAMASLRRFGFKVQAHWMPNLVGATPDTDTLDATQLFADERVRPDELKIYPCVLLEGTELQTLAARGAWKPYEHDTLTDVLANAVAHVPEYCRITRVVRDIPSTEIVAGNRVGNLRQLVAKRLPISSQRDIRAREIRGEPFDDQTLEFRVRTYRTATTTEHFAEFVTPDDRLAAFCRVSIPDEPSHPVLELTDVAIIRELHVYGQAIDPGAPPHQVQHRGLGQRLVTHAADIAREAGRPRLAVISAIGTRAYYARLGFKTGDLYQILDLPAVHHPRNRN